MKPTRAQYFFARGRPVQVLFWILLIIAPLTFAYAVAGALARLYQPSLGLWNLLRLAFYVLIALLLAFLVALVAASLLVGLLYPLWHPLYKARCAKNGAPFRVGDRVQILVGRHRGRVTTVYSDWKDDCVRVELGEAEKQKFNDIFDPIQLLREDGEP